MTKIISIMIVGIVGASSASWALYGDHVTVYPGQGMGLYDCFTQANGEPSSGCSKLAGVRCCQMDKAWWQSNYWAGDQYTATAGGGYQYSCVGTKCVVWPNIPPEARDASSVQNCMESQATY